MVDDTIINRSKFFLNSEILIKQKADLDFGASFSVIGIPMDSLSCLVPKWPLLKDPHLVYKWKVLNKLSSYLSISNDNFLIEENGLWARSYQPKYRAKNEYVYSYQL